MSANQKTLSLVEQLKRERKETERSDILKKAEDFIEKEEAFLKAQKEAELELVETIKGSEYFFGTLSLNI